MTTFVVVPQWQGSPSTRAMQLVEGAEQIAGDLPRSACTHVEVPLEAGEGLGTRTRRLSSLLRVQERMREALAPVGADRFVVVGGDGSVAIPAIAHAATAHPGLAVVWLDARAGLHSPDTSTSGALAEMALRAVFDDGDLPGAGIAPGRVISAGARALDDAETEAAAAVRMLSVADLDEPHVLVEAVTGTGADAVFVHVGLDVLDPAELAGQAAPVPFGLTLAALTAALAELGAVVPIVGAAVTGFAPASAAAAADDLGTILRVIGAVA